ncbi:MAG: kynureninase [Anaerolineales bacterium]|nr:kynureninase [Anaerolineales bacterium]
MYRATDFAYAEAQDRQDNLASFRDRFVIADPDLIYLDGNSLGRLPQATAARMAELVQGEWGRDLIGGWNHGWIDLAARLGAKIAQLIGADADEVIVADSTSVNLFKLVVAALMAQPKRHKIITDNLNFPSDLYVLQGAMQLLARPFQLEVVPSVDGVHGPVDALAQAIDDKTALVTLSHTAFKSGYLYDMKAITAQAQRMGAMVLWDLSHSVGAVPVDLHAANVDLAVGCTYKYLNGGPGAPAFMYVRRDWQNKLGNPVSGWMGQSNMFHFDLDYEPAPGMRHFLSGTPPILSLAAIEPGIDLLLEAGMERIRAKSIQQTEYLTGLWQDLLAPLGFHLNSPANPARRGSHVSLGHDEGWRIDQALIHDMKVLPDFRQPDNLRLGIAPLYTRFVDVWTAVSRLRTVVHEKLYEKYAQQVTAVT